MQQRRVYPNSDSDSPLSRSLGQVERDWIKDLAVHPGFQLFLQVCQDSMAQEFRRLRRSKDHEEMLRTQGACDAYEAVLAIPAKLLSTDRATERHRRSTPDIVTVPPEG